MSRCRQLHLFKVERAYGSPGEGDNTQRSEFSKLLACVNMMLNEIDERGHDPKRIADKVDEQLSRKSSCWFE